MKNFKHLIILIILPLSVKVAFSHEHNSQQLFEQGIPFIENFYEEDFNAEPVNYDITLSDQDKIYVLNPRGVMEFDGYQWRFIYTYKASAKDRFHYFDNKLFYIKAGQLGFLYPDEEGTFKDSILFEGENLNISYSEKKIHHTKNIVYFVTNNAVFCWTQGKSLKKYSAAGSLCGSSILNNQLLVDIYPMGLYLLTNGEFVPYFSHQVLKNKRVNNIISHNNYHILSIPYQGLFFLSNDTLKQINKKYNFFGSGFYINSDNLLFSTLMNGIIKFDENFDINGTIDFSNGLADNNITSSSLKNNNLWVCTRNGISFIAAEYPLKVYNKNSGLPGQIDLILSHNGQVYVCSKNGLFRIRNAQTNTEKVSVTEKVQGFNGLCYGAYSFGDKLLLSALSGIFIVDGLQAVPLRNYKFNSKPTTYKYQWL